MIKDGERRANTCEGWEREVTEGVEKEKKINRS